MSTIESASPEGVRSVRTALQLLDVLAERSPAGVTEVARLIGLPKSTAHRALQTLALAGWASVDEAGRYSLTSHLLSLGLMASRESGLHDAVYPEMERLRDATGETVHLSVRNDMWLVLVLRAEGTHAVRSVLPLGTRFPVYATSSGQAILATLPDERIAEVIAKMDVENTDHQQLTPEMVWKSIESARSVGYTQSTQWRHGIVGVGAVITPQMGTPSAAITVSMPVQRLADWNIDDLGALVGDAATRASKSWRGPA